MIYDTIQFFKRHGKMVIFNAIHFFDGYKSNFGYAMEVMRNANEAGADRLSCATATAPVSPTRYFPSPRRWLGNTAARWGLISTTTWAVPWPTAPLRCGLGPPRSRAITWAWGNAAATCSSQWSSPICS